SRASDSEKMSARTNDASPDGRGGLQIPGGPRPSGETYRAARNFRRASARRDSRPTVESNRRRPVSGRGAHLQAHPEYSEERKNPRRGNLGWYAHSPHRVGGYRGSPQSGRIRFSVGKAYYSPLARQSLATIHATEAGESRAQLGDLSDTAKN